MLFFHTADLHLDARTEANMPKEKARERRHELLLTLATIAETAHREGAAAVLIAGDLFDTPAPSPETVRETAGIFARFSDLTFILLRGNHDSAPLTAELSDLPNLRTFPAGGFGFYDFGDVRVWGCEDCTLTPGEIGLTPDRVNIILLHGEARETSAPGAIDLRAWQGRGADYLALGHYHTYSSSPLDARGVYVYAGCPAGRGFDECGEKGMVQIEILGNRVTESFLPLPGRRLHTVKADVTGLTDPAAILTAVESAIEDIPSSDIVKVELTGRVRADTPLSPDILRKRLSERFWFVKVKMNVVYDTDEPSGDIRLADTFAQTVHEKEKDPTLAGEILACGLAALKGEVTL